MADAIAVARGNIDAFNAGDWERFRNTLAPDAIYDELATQRRLQRDDAVEASKGWKAAFPDSKGTITNAFASGDQVTLEVTWEGTQTGPMESQMGTIPPSGKPVRIPAVQVVTVSGDHIKETRHYFDLMGLLVQIGAVPAPAAARS
jgi:steroid delta-isomerase-like uncharacterized protein